MLAAGCAVPDVQFFADDASPDHAAVDAAGDASTDDGPADAGQGDGADATADAAPGCPGTVPPDASTCCGSVACFGSQCSNSMLCLKCAGCTTGDVCCTKANSYLCWGADAGACPP